MKFLEPNVVVIDDVKAEIQGILDYYQTLGVGCKLFNASYFDGDEMPSKVYSDVNLIFLDLFYSDKFDAEQCSNWILSLIPEKSYYILILWTKDIAKAEEVLEYLKKANRIPYVKLLKSKIDYITTGDSKYDFIKLFEDINNELDKIPALEEIQLWRRSVKLSANEILGNLTKDSNPNNFVNKLKKIITSHGGNSIKQESNKRKRSILFDALDNVLISNTKKNLYDHQITDLNRDDLYNLETSQAVSIDKELNSWFHFKLDDNISSDLITPGLISSNNHKLFKKLYSIQDDHKLEPIFQKLKTDQIVFDDIVLLINRPCDVAQSKMGKNIKLLSGIIINKASRKTNGKIEFVGLLPDSVKMFDHLYLDEIRNDVTLIFDFRYIFSVPEKVYKDKFKNIKVFNKELLSDIQVEYSSYSSRLGITQII
jgi:hypothetical protein